MPTMGGSVRTVFASCSELKELLPTGIMRGDVSIDTEKQIMGFGAEARPIVPGEIYFESTVSKVGEIAEK